MKNLFLALALVCLSTLSAQQNEIQLQTSYGSENEEIHQLMRFQGVETTKLAFSGNSLKGKHYRFLLKEFKDGKLLKQDTLMDSKKYGFEAVDSTVFNLQYYVKTQVNNTIKMSLKFSRFSTPRTVEITKTEDEYALHDFLGNQKYLTIQPKTETNILVYFLPFLNKESGFKSYCDVSGSKHKPEDWGTVYGIPSYFIVSVEFE